MRFATVFVLASCLYFVSAGLASAQPAVGATDEYEATIAAALQEFEAHRFPEARALFERAFRLFPNARALRGIGVAAFEMRDYPHAWVALRAALVHGARPLTPDQRVDADALIARTELFLSRVELVGVPSGASVLVDGRAPVMDGGAILTGPGRHTISIEAQGMLLKTYEIEAESGARQRIVVELVPRDTPVARPAPPAEPVERGITLSWPRRAPRTPPPITRAGAGALSFSVVADTPGLGLSLQTRGGRPTALCSLPCELHLDPGAYTFLIERRRRDPIVTPTVELHSSGRLELALVSRRRPRTRRLVFGIVLSAAGLIGSVASARPLCHFADLGDCETVKPALGAGIAAIVLGLGLDIAAARTDDRGRVTYSAH